MVRCELFLVERPAANSRKDGQMLGGTALSVRSLSIEDPFTKDISLPLQDKVNKRLLPEQTLKVMDFNEDCDMDEELYDDIEEGGSVEKMQLNFLNLKVEDGRGSFFSRTKGSFKNRKTFRQNVLEQRQRCGAERFSNPERLERHREHPGRKSGIWEHGRILTLREHSLIAPDSYVTLAIPIIGRKRTTERKALEMYKRVS